VRKQIFICVAICFGLWFCAQKASAESWYTVRWVDDGDSIVLQDGRHVRYIGINAPEIQHEERKAEPFGDKAKSINQKLVFHKDIRLEYDREKKDRYGRTLAYVYLRNGLFINAEMISQGAAYFLYLRPNTKHTELFIRKQQEAMQAGRGLWQNWRESNSEYVGNKNSRRFHLPSCPFARQIKAANRVRFSKKWDAFRAGYAPAKRCVVEWGPQ
jgi:micrococcal nuclease